MTTTISATANPIAVTHNRIGDNFRPSPLASRMNGSRNVTSAPAKLDVRRAGRGAVGREVPGQTRSTRSAGVKNIARLSSLDDSDNQDGGTANAADDAESIVPVTAKSALLQSHPRLDDFSKNFEKDKLPSLFAAAGKNKATLETLFTNSTNNIAKGRLKDIAAVYHIAKLKSEASQGMAGIDEAMKDIDDVMARLTKKMVADKLGEKSIFGAPRYSIEKEYGKVKDLENELLARLATLIGESPYAAGNFLRTQHADPFIRDYVNRELGISLTPDQSKRIDDLLNSRAKRTWDYVHEGMREHQTAEIEKVCSIINMVLELPNLLEGMDVDLAKIKSSSATATLEQQPKPNPWKTETDEDEIKPATDRLGNNQEKTNGPPKPGNIKNSYDFSTHITYNPINIKINMGNGKSGKKKPHTDRADAATNTDPVRISTQNKHVIDVGPPPTFAMVEEQAMPIHMAELFSRLKAIRIVEPPLQVAARISPPVLLEVLAHHEPVRPQEQKATVGTQAVESTLNKAQSEIIAPLHVEAPTSTVIHSQALSTPAPQYATPLSKTRDVPLAGINHTMADNKRFAKITGSPVSRAQVHNLPPLDNGQQVIKDEDASWTHEQTRSHALKGPQPVVLTNQGRQLSQLPRVRPKVEHFAPSNLEKEDLTAAKNRLKKTGMDYLSPRLEAFKPGADGGAETRARAQQRSRADVAQMMAQDTQAPQAAAPQVIPAAETKAVPLSKPSAPWTTEPTVSQPAVGYQPVVLSASGLRRPNRTHGTLGANHFVPMGETQEVLPMLSNGGTDYTSKRLAAYKPGANDIKEDGKS